MGLFGSTYHVNSDGSLTDADTGEPAPDHVVQQHNQIMGENRAWAAAHPDIIARANGGGGRGGGADPGAHEFKPDYNDPSICQECGKPRSDPAHEAVGSRFGPGNDDPDADEEEQRGPGGDKMPRLGDLPSYTIWGQVLKKFSG